MASLSYEARLLLVGLISFADDEGRFIATIAAIRGYVFPHDAITDAHVRKLRDEVAHTKVVVIYWADGLELGAFPNWGRHQRINRPTPSVIPPPP